MSTSNNFVINRKDRTDEEGVTDTLIKNPQQPMSKKIIDKLIDLKYKFLFKLTDIEFYINTHPEVKTDFLVYGGCLLFLLITFVAIMFTTN